ncbi:MAG: sigma-70 family RNA polymerase sigma factor [Saprospiraceae bacterium]|nr:sigma-70 family RNA polymerase sigma factor [Saprospiraceae bacterium]
MDQNKRDSEGHSREELSDEEIAERLKLKKDRSLQSELYDRYINKVYFKCLSITNDSALARDFAHDIFIKIFTNLHQFKGKAKLSLWIHSITYHHCIRQLQRKGKIIYSDEVETDEVSINIAEELFTREELRDKIKILGEAMKLLNVEDRLLLLMKYQDDYCIEQICAQLNLAPSAVKMRLMRARNKLKNELNTLFKNISQ